MWPLLSSETFLPYSEPDFSPVLRRRSLLFVPTSHIPYISKEKPRSAVTVKRKIEGTEPCKNKMVSNKTEKN